MQNNTHIAFALAAVLTGAPSASMASTEQNPNKGPALSPATTSINVCVHTQTGNITVVETAAGCGRLELFVNIPLSSVLGPVGPQGPVGPVGARGPQGPKGDTGAAGSQGEVGDVGATGPEGPIGAKGAVGPEGPKGPQGAQGVTGDQGRIGPAGAPGGPGAQGPNGFQGPQGAQGPAGSPGASGLFRFDQNFTLPSSDWFASGSNFPQPAADLFCPSGANILGISATPISTSVVGEHVSFELMWDRARMHWYNLDLFTKPFRVTLWCAWTR